MGMFGRAGVLARHQQQIMVRSAHPTLTLNLSLCQNLNVGHPPSGVIRYIGAGEGAYATF